MSLPDSTKDNPWVSILSKRGKGNSVSLARFEIKTEETIRIPKEIKIEQVVVSDDAFNILNDVFNRDAIRIIKLISNSRLNVSQLSRSLLLDRSKLMSILDALETYGVLSSSYEETSSPGRFGKYYNFKPEVYATLKVQVVNLISEIG